jgi:hypothetical protein
VRAVLGLDLDRGAVAVEVDGQVFGDRVEVGGVRGVGQADVEVGGPGRVAVDDGEVDVDDRRGARRRSPPC